MNLSPQQIAAIETDSREALVIAAAGSGKTTVLVHRVVHLIRTGQAKPTTMMILTFTRKAAGEMIARLATALELSEEQLKRDALIGTFHAIALRMLREDGNKLGYATSGMTVIDATDSGKLLMSARDDLGFRGKLSDSFVESGLGAVYSGIPLESLTSVPETARRLSLVIGEYRSRLFNHNALDYGSILLEVNRLLRQCPDVLAAWRERVQHVLVDELQDADAIQYNLHEHFSPPATFFGVGDPRQSIYGWRGARPDLMAERHPRATIFPLDECRRCGDSIVDAANKTIAVSFPSLPPMQGATSRTGRVSIIHGRSEDIAKHVDSLVKGGAYAAHDIAIIARNHRTLRRLHAIFLALGVEAHRVGSDFDFCDTPAFVQVHALMRLATNMRDDFAFLRAAPLLGVYVPDARALATKLQTSMLGAYLQEHGDSPVATWLDGSEGGHQTKASLQALKEALAGNRAADEWHRRAIDWWIRRCGFVSIDAALKWFAVVDAQEDVLPEGRVTLITAHAAKGLEWPVVLLANLNEGEFPSSQALRSHGGVSDERLLFYVAATRAREHLILHTRRPVDQNLDRPLRPVCRFIEEALPGALRQIERSATDGERIAQAM